MCLQPLPALVDLNSAFSVAGETVPTDEEIREICRRVLLAQHADQFKAALTELKIAIRAHITMETEGGYLQSVLQNKPQARKKSA
jgi:hypothetical protein